MNVNQSRVTGNQSQSELSLPAATPHLGPTVQLRPLRVLEPQAQQHPRLRAAGGPSAGLTWCCLPSRLHLLGPWMHTLHQLNAAAEGTPASRELCQGPGLTRHSAWTPMSQPCAVTCPVPAGSCAPSWCRGRGSAMARPQDCGFGNRERKDLRNALVGKSNEKPGRYGWSPRPQKWGLTQVCRTPGSVGPGEAAAPC